MSVLERLRVFYDESAKLLLELPVLRVYMCVPVIKAEFYPDYFFKKLETSGSEVFRGSCLKDGHRSINIRTPDLKLSPATLGVATLNK